MLSLHIWPIGIISVRAHDIGIEYRGFPISVQFPHCRKRVEKSYTLCLFMWHVLNRHRMQTLHIHLHGRSELVQVSNYWCPIIDGFIQF